MDDAKTVWCGNLSEKVTEELLYELFLQAAPLERVKIPTDKEGRKLSYGFITFKHEISVEYALKLFNGISLFEKTLNLRHRNNNGQQNQSDRNDKRNNHRQEINYSPNQPYSYQELMRFGDNMINPNIIGHQRDDRRWNDNHRSRDREDRPYNRHSRHHESRQHDYDAPNRSRKNNYRNDRRYKHY